MIMYIIFAEFLLFFFFLGECSSSIILNGTDIVTEFAKYRIIVLPFYHCYY